MLPGIAAADEGGQHITITPSSAELSIAPGQTASNSVIVVNQGQDSFKVNASVAPYHVKGINYDPQFTPLPGTVDASKWVHLDTTQLPVLSPGQLVHLGYTVSVPAGTAPGGYYAVVFAETSPVKNNSGVVAHNRVGEILYMTVKGPVRMSGNVLPGSLSHFSFTGSIPVALLVRNTGGVHFKTTVTVSVKNIFGKEVYKQAATRYVLPQTERNIVLTWNDHVPLGLYHVQRQATIPSGTVHLPGTWVFIVQPWLIVLVIIALVVLLAVWLRKKRERRKQA